MPASRKAERRVNVSRGQTLLVSTRPGVQLEVELFQSGAVEVRNAITRRVIRSWAPKDRDDR